jgi:hypothetical protein
MNFTNNWESVHQFVKAAYRLSNTGHAAAAINWDSFDSDDRGSHGAGRKVSAPILCLLQSTNTHREVYLGRFSWFKRPQLYHGHQRALEYRFNNGLGS